MGKEVVMTVLFCLGFILTGWILRRLIDKAEENEREVGELISKVNDLTFRLESSRNSLSKLREEHQKTRQKLNKYEYVAKLQHVSLSEEKKKKMEE